MKFNSRILLTNAIAAVFLLCITLPQTEACKKAAAPAAPGRIKDSIQKYEAQLKGLEAQQAQLANQSPKKALDAVSASSRSLARQIRNIKQIIEQLNAELLKSEAYYKAKEEREKARAAKLAARMAQRRGNNQQTAQGSGGPAKASDTGFDADSDESDEASNDDEHHDHHDDKDGGGKQPAEHANKHEQTEQHEQGPPADTIHDGHPKSAPQAASNRMMVEHVQKQTNDDNQ